MVFGEIFRLGGLIPKIIRRGNKLYEMEIRKPGIVTQLIFRDTLNHMPVRLSKLPATFNLPVKDKGHFPYLFNKEENLGISFLMKIIFIF